MENLITEYDRNRRKNQLKKYEFTGTRRVGNVMRKIYKKDGIDYIMNKGKFMKLTTYVSKYVSKDDKVGSKSKCKRDCTKLTPKKVCNQTTLRCNLQKNVVANTKKFLNKKSK